MPTGMSLLIGKDPIASETLLQSHRPMTMCGLLPNGATDVPSETASSQLTPCVGGARPYSLLSQALRSTQLSIRRQRPQRLESAPVTSCNIKDVSVNGCLTPPRPALVAHLHCLERLM